MNLESDILVYDLNVIKNQKDKDEIKLQIRKIRGVFDISTRTYLSRLTGEDIIKMINLTGLTDIGFAKKLGISKKTITRWKIKGVTNVRECFGIQLMFDKLTENIIPSKMVVRS